SAKFLFEHVSVAIVIIWQSFKLYLILFLMFLSKCIITN
ncbi:hypothetical protein X975_15372, partial [Stegodyphus mimosarum]